MSYISKITLPTGTSYDISDYRGTVGTNGDITTLPTAAAENKGWVYKVITTGVVTGAAVGDFVRSDGSAWCLTKSTDTTYSAATISTAGLMSASDKTKLNGIATGAEVNQNAFSNVAIGSTTIQADSKTDTLTLVQGSNVTLTPDATNDKITISATDTTYSSKSAASGGTDVSLVTTGEKYTWNNKANTASPAFSGTPTAPTAADGTNTTQIATTAFVMNTFKAQDAMIFKGTIGSSGATVTSLPATHDAGWTYKVITAGTYAGQACEIGDMIVCVKDGTTASDADWSVIQNNVDGAVTGPASSTDVHVAVFNGTSGKVIKDSGFTIGKSVPSNAVFTDNDTKNTAGATDTSSKIFLIGATAQTTNPQTYSQDTAYVGTDGCLYSNGTKVITDISGKADKSATVTSVAYDTTNDKFTKTINGNTSLVAKTQFGSIPNVTSVGSAPTLGTAIAADDITKWTSNTPTSVTLPTYSVSGETLTITAGSVTAGVAATLQYTARSIPNVTSVGSAPTLGTAISAVTGFATTES